MKNRKFKITPAESRIEWVGKKVTGAHHGTIAIKEGELLLQGELLVGGRIVADTSSITILDIADPAANAQFAGHLASDDFFSSDRYPEAVLEILSMMNDRVEASLTIKGITHRLSFPATLDATEDQLTATAKLMVDRTLYDMKFRSGNFFKDLGDTLIYNDFELNVLISARVTEKSFAILS